MSTSMLFGALLFTTFSISSVAARPRGVGSGGSRRCYDNAGNVVPCPVNKTAIIAGVVVGVVALIVGIIILLFILKRRKRMRRLSGATLATNRGPSFEKTGVAHDNVNPPQPALVSENKGINRWFGQNQNPNPNPPHQTAPVGTYAPPSGPPPA